MTWSHGNICGCASKRQETRSTNRQNSSDSSKRKILNLVSDIKEMGLLKDSPRLSRAFGPPTLSEKHLNVRILL